MTKSLGAGDLRLPPLSAVFVDGMPLHSIILAKAVNHSVVPSQREEVDQHFFSTPTRALGDPIREVFEVSLATPQRINRVQFSLAHFPQRAWVQYLDSDTGQWTMLTQANGLHASVTLSDSIPQLVSSGVSDASHIHPQHFGGSHWTAFDFKVTPIQASLLRIVMTRLWSQNGPQSSLGKFVPYSLGVKDFSAGYIVSGPEDLPSSTRSSTTVTERDPIASSTDLLGSSVEYTLRENRASDLLAGRGAIWRSGPQPISNAVVCLYLDARDAQGYPQIVDRFFLDPLYSGCTVNLYHSLDVPSPARFPASETPLTFPLARPFGAVPPVPDPSGILFPSTTAFLDLDNSALQFDTTQPFQIYAVFRPQFPSTTTDSAVLYDDGLLSLSWGLDPTGGTTGGAFMARLGSMLAIRTGIDFAFNTELAFALTFDGGQLTLDTPGSTDTSISGEVETGAAPAPTLRLGGSLTTQPQDSVPGNLRLSSMMIKQGNLDTPEDRAAYLADPHGYVTTPDYPGPGPQSTDNALLRYDPSQQTQGSDSINPYGLLGGPGVIYDRLRWTPVGRDYRLRQGFFDMNPTKARFFKFEFSNLAAEPYETNAPVILTAKTFAVQSDPGNGRATAQSAATGGSGMTVNTSVAAVNRFADQNRLRTSSPTTTATYLPTEAMQVTDPQGAARMEAAAPYWNFSQFQAGATMPRFSEAAQHYYETVSVRHSKRVAYFVGLRSIAMYRVDRRIADDQDQYLELFHDAHDLVIDPSVPSWSLADGRITTPSTLDVRRTLTSQPYNSFRAISGVQFATTQTEARQLLTDADFDDAALQYWQPMGDATIVPDRTYNTDVGSLVRVRRGGNPVTWSSMQAAYPTWAQIEDSNPSPYLPTWKTLQGSTKPSSSGGIQSSETVTPSSIGKLYAAVRVVSPKTLTAPLTLQLVNGNGEVLAQNPMLPLGGQVTEWFVEHDIGTGKAPDENLSWAEVEALGTWAQVEAQGSWNALQQVIAPPLNVRDVRVQLFQDQATSDEWFVDNLSIYNDPILWEVSRDGGRTWWPVWDIRNDPHGVFLFPDEDQSAPGGGSSFVWRVTGDAPDLAISALQVRFWFDSLMMGSPFTRTLQHNGPNLTPLDQYPDVTEDPMFRAWHGAIPQDWWYVYRQWVRQHAQTPTITQRPFLPDTLPVGVDEGSPQAPARNIMPTSIVYPR